MSRSKTEGWCLSCGVSPGTPVGELIIYVGTELGTEPGEDTYMIRRHGQSMLISGDDHVVEKVMEVAGIFGAVLEQVSCEGEA